MDFTQLAKCGVANCLYCTVSLSCLTIDLPFGRAGWQQLDVGSAVTGNMAWKEKCILLSVVQEEQNYILHCLHCESVDRKPSRVAINTGNNAILTHVLPDVVQPLAANGMKKTKHLWADWLSLMEIASVALLWMCRLAVTTVLLVLEKATSWPRIIMSKSCLSRTASCPSHEQPQRRCYNPSQTSHTQTIAQEGINNLVIIHITWPQL